MPDKDRTNMWRCLLRACHLTKKEQEADRKEDGIWLPTTLGQESPDVLWRLHWSAQAKGPTGEQREAGDQQPYFHQWWRLKEL